MLQEQIVEKYPAIDTFSKGMNQSVNEQLIGIDEAYIAQNVDIKDGSLNMCKGYTRLDDTSLPSGRKVIMRHFDDDDDSYMLVAVDNKIFKYDDGKSEEIYSGLKSIDFTYINYQIDMDRITIMTNGVDPVLVYDGKSFRKLKFMGKDSDEDEDIEEGMPNEAPRGKYIILHRERVWISGVKDNPNNVYHSAPMDPDDWTVPAGVGEDLHGEELNIPTWDGGVIVGIKSLFDDVMVFKNKNVFRIFGTYPGNYNVVQVFDTVYGDILYDTIASVENFAFWASTDGLHIFNGTNAEVISGKVEKLYQSANKDYLHRAVATIYDRKYIISLPTDGSKTNNTVIEYDIDTQAFVIRTGLRIDSFLELKRHLYFVNNEGQIFLYNDGNDFDGKPIHMLWESGFSSYGEQQARKILNRIYFNAKGPGKVKITCITERKEVSRIIDLTDDWEFYRYRLRNKGRFIKFKIENVDGCNVNLRQFQYMLDLDYD